MEIITKKTKNTFFLKGFFKEDKIKNAIEQNNYITDFIDEEKSYIYLGEKKNYSKKIFLDAVNKIVTSKTRNYDIDGISFLNEEKGINKCTIIRTFIFKDSFSNGEDLYTSKTSKEKKKFEFKLFLENIKKEEELIKKSHILAKNVNLARSFQATPPNICNSEWLASQMESKLKKVGTKISFKILNKKQIEAEKMGLFLSVNRGSAYEARLVVAEYKGDKTSKEKIVLIGKGITFDSGGYNLKGSAFIQGMKYDMSGAAICFSTFLAITELNPKINISIVLPLTDNRISSDASLPDSIWTSMNGKTVEINNTDAEGRLILADGITYAIKKLNATKLIDVATLTGAIIISLGKTFTGLWSTSDCDWNLLEKCGIKHDELLWRMPFHDDFLLNIKNSNFADMKNTDLTGKGGSISAAMFLKEFTENVPYIHFDIAGTAGDGDNPTGVLVKTLTEYLIKKAEGNKNEDTCSIK
ncbi:MAG: M17 family metallopeptidase [Metamycoplasmataceae bacterium]